jgi:hypothetical protein
MMRSLAGIDAAHGAPIYFSRIMVWALAVSVSLGAAFGASAASADLENENLLITAPPGYKVGFSDKKPNMVMTEFVPTKETVENWTEMVTMQVFFGLKATPQFMDEMEKNWRRSPGRPGSQHHRGRSRKSARLPEKSAERQAGNHRFKVVQGNDSFYLVQKAFRFEPSKEQITQWMGYLRKVSVCDSRIADRACPKTAN